MFFYIILILSFFIFSVGVFGIMFNRKHLIIILISLELMLLSTDINFILFSIFLNDILGQMNVLIILTVAAAEVALGLGILVVFFRLRGGIEIDLITLLKG